jgi:hypothetical protein
MLEDRLRNPVFWYLVKPGFSETLFFEKTGFLGRLQGPDKQFWKKSG